MKLSDINLTIFNQLEPEVQLAIVNQPDYSWLAIIPLILFITLTAWLMR